MIDAMADFPESAKFVPRVFLLTCLSFVACRGLTNDGGPQHPSATAPGDAGQDSRHSGMEVSTGFITMNGATEVTCAFEQNEDDQVQLQVTVSSRCNTVGDIDLTVTTPGTTPAISLSRKMQQSFKANRPHTFPELRISSAVTGNAGENAGRGHVRRKHQG